MKKTKTQELILESGKRWFLKKGFKSAPLRSIVRDTGFTPGAFYGYYKTKEELFYALTDQTAKEALDIIKSIAEDMASLPPERMLYDMVDCYIKRLPELVNYLCSHRDAITLILRCSEGTKYENYQAYFRDRNRLFLKKATEGARESGLSVHNLASATYELLMRGYFHMLSLIFLEEEEPEKILRMMEDIALVYKNGMLHLMEREEGL